MTTPISRRTLLAAALAAVPASRVAAGGHRGGGMLRLIANENPYGPSPAARAAAEQGVADGWKYAMQETRALKKQLAELNGVPTDHIMVSAGSAEALRVTALNFCRGGGRVIAARPTFAFLTGYAATLGCDVDWISLDDQMVHDLEGMAASVREDSRLLYVCNPNNPTGTMIDGPTLRDFLAEVAPRVPVIVDEAYLDLRDDAANHTAVPRVLAGDPVIITRTFSKLHGMAGMRVGYAIARPDVIKQLEALRVSMMNRPGVVAASASLADADFIEFSRARIRESMAITTGVFDELGLSYTPSHGNFVLVDTGRPARKFMAAMRERGIMTGMPTKPFPTWVRVSMGTVEQMRQFGVAARDYFSGAA
ncbi:MAG: histidinol-phosphate transaminase [Gammaproteobacteria bacterium]|nr:histidinol-phosphate transaminase [Gammaproteobacteria bacterium]